MKRSSSRDCRCWLNQGLILLFNGEGMASFWRKRNVRQEVPDSEAHREYNVLQELTRLRHNIRVPGQAGSAGHVFELVGKLQPHLTVQVWSPGGWWYYTQQDIEEGFTLLLPILVAGLRQEGATPQVCPCNP